MKLPVHYNPVIQGFIYRNIDEILAEKYHSEGYRVGKRKFNFFTFSRLYSKHREYIKEEKSIIFRDYLILRIASLDVNLLESFVTHLVHKKRVKIGRNFCEVSSIEVEMPPPFSRLVIVKTISPITTYSTLIDPYGKKKTYFYNPSEADFPVKLMENLQRKYLALINSPFSLSTPVKSNEEMVGDIEVIKIRKEIITYFKDTLIKGWDVVLRLNLSEPFFELAYNVGLGSKNSQGFGMVEVVRGEEFS